MKLVRSTLLIYQDAGVVAARAFVRSAWAFGLLLVFFPLLWFLSALVAPLGMLGGMLVALVNAACAGTYLATLQDALTVRRPVDFAMVRGNLSRHTNDVLSILFPLWILQLVVGLLQLPLVPLLVTIAVTLFFNPAPEMIGRSRTRGLEMLGDAAKFMGANWPEWIVPQVVAIGLAAVVFPGSALGIVSLFGPFFGFTNAGSLVLTGGTGLVGWLIGLAAVAFVHLVMLFRGALYERLSTSGRRARAWQANFR